MSKATSPIPAGHEGLIPHLVCDPCADAIEFYKRAFGAEEVHRAPAPDGRRIMHAAIRIGGRFVFLVDDFPEFCGGKASSPKALNGTPVTIHQYVKDCDAAIKRAADAGARILMPAQDMFWGDRYGVVTDPFGHNWSFATHLNAHFRFGGLNHQSHNRSTAARDAGSRGRLAGAEGTTQWVTRHLARFASRSTPSSASSSGAPP